MKTPSSKKVDQYKKYLRDQKKYNEEEIEENVNGKRKKRKH